ncbi:MAG: hypothetical protein IKR48_01630, partial [Kiritimatiellae bacterium]|nr:hypothetical protein [Kiritimatiellia bacterium]
MTRTTKTTERTGAMKRLFVLALAVVAFAAFGGGVSAPECKIVDPAEFGFLPGAAPDVNAAALQRALDGGGRTVRVAKPGVYGLDRDVFIDSDTTLEFAPGAVLKKMKTYQHVLVNRGAYNYGCDSNIVVRNLEISVNKMEKEPDPNSNAPGLNGHISFYRVK